MSDVSWLKLLIILALGFVLIMFGIWINGFFQDSAHQISLSMGRLVMGGIITVCGLVVLVFGLVGGLLKAVC
jgi:hypothetical protein